MDGWTLPCDMDTPHPDFGKAYRPGRILEANRFIFRNCSECVHYKVPSKRGPLGCSILARMAIFDIDEPSYPQELIIGEDGSPACTNLTPHPIEK